MKMKTISTPENKIWSSTDLFCSASLVTAGFELLALEKVDEQRVKFVFRWKPGIEKAAVDFFSNRSEQKSHKLFENLKTLKSRTHNHGN